MILFTAASSAEESSQRNFSPCRVSFFTDCGGNDGGVCGCVVIVEWENKRFYREVQPGIVRKNSCAGEWFKYILENMKYQNMLLTILLSTSLVCAKSAPTITPAYLKTQISGIHRLEPSSITKLGALIKKLPHSTRTRLTTFAKNRLKQVTSHPLKGNILIGDLHKVTQDNLTQLVKSLTT